MPATRQTSSALAGMCMLKSKKEWSPMAAREAHAPAASIRSDWDAFHVRTNAANNSATSPPITAPPIRPVSARICA